MSVKTRVARTPTLATFAVIAGVTLFLYLVRHILLPFVIGGIIAYVCAPLIDWLERRSRVPRAIWSLALLLVFAIIVGAIAFLAAPPLVTQLVQILGNLHGAVERFIREFIGGGSYTILGQQITAAKAADYVVNSLRDWVSQGGRLLFLATIAFAAVFGFFLTWVITGYLLNDAPGIGRGLVWLVPPNHRGFARRIWADLDPVLRRYFIGVAVVVIYASTAAYIGLGVILGVHHALFLALLTGVLEVIPLVGPAASAVIAGLVAVQQATTSWGIVGYVIYVALLRISIDEFFGPIVLGKAANVRPVVVIFCFLTGALLFGVVGVVLAVPVALALKAALANLYRDEPEEA